ncbi:hypothetical protein ColLi_07694 [Colletotrichum liriopes]|uniref:Uncharacterized protein n=1 Tax=Colletotrichum liriopes TaxID=708192 RepID=A0AA37GPK7_9PEZI|nr:hypothetical protein ColLi_07694 [Colletotrichum liriopes]
MASRQSSFTTFSIRVPLDSDFFWFLKPLICTSQPVNTTFSVAVKNVSHCQTVTKTSPAFVFSVENTLNPLVRGVSAVAIVSSDSGSAASLISPENAYV